MGAMIGADILGKQDDQIGTTGLSRARDSCFLTVEVGPKYSGVLFSLPLSQMLKTKKGNLTATMTFISETPVAGGVWR